MQTRASLALLLLSAFLTACSNDTPPPPQATESVQTEPTPTQPAGIAWFQGSLEDAFATAKAEDKPLFSYWGAEWCPYCKELQANIFIREEFIRLSRQFVPLDMSNGDSEVILYADEFKIYGLPTVIVFSPEGEELTRLPGGMDMERYAAVLELTLNQVRPVAALVDAALAGETLAERDWQLLGSYSWFQDTGLALGEENPSQRLLDLQAVAPDDDLLRSRLAMSALGVWLGEDEETRDASLAQTHVEAVTDILANPSLAEDSLMSLASIGVDIVELSEADQQLALQESLLSLYVPAVEDHERNLLNRASVLSAWAEVATVLLEEGESLSEEQQRWAGDQATVMVAALDNYQVHAGINSLWGVYYDIGQEQQARETLGIGIERSKAPFYFMSGMGSIERDAGNTAEALAWYRRAWEATSQPLDRGRWGSGYLRRLVSMTPDDVSEIQRASSVLVADLASQKNGLVAYERGLGRISAMLQEWAAESEQRQAAVAEVRKEMVIPCADIGLEGDGRATCDSFLQG